MTAVPHEGSRRGSVRKGGGARLIRPSVTSQKRKSAPGGSDSRTALSSSSSVPTSDGALSVGPLAIPGLSGLINGKPIRLVLAGRKIRLGSSAFLLMVGLALSVILVALLMLNTALAQDSFRLQDYKIRANDAVLKEQQLSAQVAAAQSPVGLEQLATNLGMVAGGAPVFLRLSDGNLLGQGTPGLAPPEPEKPKKKKAPATVTVDPNATVPGAAVDPGGEFAVPVDPTTPVVPVAPGAPGSVTPGTPSGGGALVPGPVVPGSPVLPVDPGGEQSIGIVVAGQ